MAGQKKKMVRGLGRSIFQEDEMLSLLPNEQFELISLEAMRLPLAIDHQDFVSALCKQPGHLVRKVGQAIKYFCSLESQQIRQTAT